MSRRSHTLAVALCASLALHGAIVYWGLHALINSKIFLAGWDRRLVEEEPSGATAPAKIFVEKLPDTALGAEDGEGHSIDPAAGDHPLEARQGDQDQQFLSRDPAGAGKIGDAPSPAILPPAPESTAEPSPAGAPAFGVAAAPSLPTIPSKITQRESTGQNPGESQETDPPSPDAPDMIAIASADTAAPAPAPPQPAANPGAATAQQASDKPANPSSNLPAADPAPMAESETDPSAVVGSVHFRSGRSEVQAGRKHRVVRPRFDVGAQSDMLKLRTPLVVALKIELDATGKVTHVDFARSSGSEAIDQAIKVAVYQWWLEPSKDKTGRPKNDVIPFVIRLD